MLVIVTVVVVVVMKVIVLEMRNALLFWLCSTRLI